MAVRSKECDEIGDCDLLVRVDDSRPLLLSLRIIGDEAPGVTDVSIKDGVVAAVV